MPTPYRSTRSSSGPIVADILVGVLLFWLVQRWTAHRPGSGRLALIAAGLYLFNPVTWYDSAVWGQTDAVGTLVILLGLAALTRGNSEGASALAIVAALVKPQFGVVILPVVGIILLRRHLLKPGSGPQHSVLLPARLRGWFESELGAWRLVSSGVTALVVLLIAPLAVPVGHVRLRGQMAGTAAGYPWLSVNAYNPWALHRRGRGRPAGPGRRLVVRHRGAARSAARRGDRVDPARRRLRDRASARGMARRPGQRRARDDLPGTRLLHAPNARPRALHVPDLRAAAAARGGRPALARRDRDAVHRRVHQPARHPDHRAVRHAQPRAAALRRAVPPAAGHHRQRRPQHRRLRFHLLAAAPLGMGRDCDRALRAALAGAGWDGCNRGRRGRCARSPRTASRAAEHGPGRSGRRCGRRCDRRLTTTGSGHVVAPGVRRGVRTSSARSERPARGRVRRTPGPARPAAHRARLRQRPGAARVPPRGPLRDALRRGLPRPNGDRVRAGLAL